MRLFLPKTPSVETHVGLATTESEIEMKPVRSSARCLESKVGTRRCLRERHQNRGRRGAAERNWSAGLRRDAGAAIVEMAFIFSLLVMLLVGTVTAAIAFAQKNSIENAAREASRYGATLPDAADSTWLLAVRDVARSGGQGNLEPGVDGQYICVAHLGGSGGVQSLVDDGGVVSQPNTPCYADGLSDVRVQVVTGRATEINAALFSIDVDLVAEVSARYERSP